MQRCFGDSSTRVLDGESEADLAGLFDKANRMLG
jgi:hypothetical protein